MTCDVHFKATGDKIQHRWDNAFKTLTIFPDASNFSPLHCVALHIHMCCLREGWGSCLLPQGKQIV